MASMYTISIGLLVILASVYCSSVSAISLAPVGRFFPKTPIFKPPVTRYRPSPRYTPFPPRYTPSPRRSFPPYPNFPPSPPPPRYHYPPTTTTLEPAFKKAELFGEKLAKKYFGDESINGFRWGYDYKQGKRIHSVQRKCGDFEKVIGSSCPQLMKQTSVVPDSNVHCIVVVTNFGKSNEACLEQYESGEYPKEATCNLDYPKTLGSECLGR